MARLIILIGLPGTGKSTYAKEYLNDHIENTVWCSSDNIREELYGDASILGRTDKVFGLLHERVANYLRKGYTVVYDTTNVNRRSRKSIIKLGKNLGATIHGVVCWSSLQECIDRDAARNRTVGADIIDKFLKRFQAPYYDEGFDTLEVRYNTSILPWDYMAHMRVGMMIPHDNPHHTYDIWTHCTEAANLMEAETQDPNLVFTMQYHDCGKPYTKFFKESDPTHAHYYNHNNVGAYLIYGAFVGLEKELLDKILFVSWAITNHMEPFFDSGYYRDMRDDLKKQIDLIHKIDKAAH